MISSKSAIDDIIYACDSTDLAISPSAALWPAPVSIASKLQLAFPQEPWHESTKRSKKERSAPISSEGPWSESLLAGQLPQTATRTALDNREFVAAPVNVSVSIDQEMARSAGLEPAALGFEARYSIQLSYERWCLLALRRGGSLSGEFGRGKGEGVAWVVPAPPPAFGWSPSPCRGGLEMLDLVQCVVLHPSWARLDGS